MSYRPLFAALFVSISLLLVLRAPSSVAGPPDGQAGPHAADTDPAVVSQAPAESATRTTLVLPPAARSVQLVIGLPAGNEAPRRGSGALVRLEGTAARVPAQLGVAVAQDGSADLERGLLMASIPAPQEATKACRYRFAPLAADHPTSPFRFVDAGPTGIEIRAGQDRVLVYNYGVVTGADVPTTDPRRQRACYIHPLWDLDGQVLTDDFPKDHYHHHGVFWAWPHVGIDSQQYDLWLYGNIQQKFVRWMDRTTGPVAAVLGVENGWFVGERKVMIERLWVRVFKTDADARAIDVTLVLIPVDKPVTLWGAAGKSYGGLTVRFAPRPPGSTVITVPSGRAADDLLNTPLAWADFTAPFGGDARPSGVAIFVDPRAPDFPQDWLTRHYGALCVGWPGIKPQTFPAGQPVRLDYRLWVHRGQVDRDGLNAAYQAFEAATHARWRP